tara:strand:- start:35 stop:805 length:771 start_codon:yes stop_codon:yes gene_type:complete
VEKALCEFSKMSNKKDGLRSDCKICNKAYYQANKEKNAERDKAYCEANKEKIAQRAKDRYQANKEKFAQRAKAYREANKEKIAQRRKAYYQANRDKIAQRAKDRYQANKEKRKAYREANKEKRKAYNQANRDKITKRLVANEKKRMATDPAFKMKRRAGISVYQTLKNQGKTKGGSTFSALPYTPQDLVEHLEKQFEEKMNWDNYGTYWHLDHIYPQSLLPYDNLAHPNFQKCWALDNLQPLEAIENIKKGNKVLG